MQKGKRQMTAIPKEDRKIKEPKKILCAFKFRDSKCIKDCCYAYDCRKALSLLDTYYKSKFLRMLPEELSKSKSGQYSNAVIRSDWEIDYFNACLAQIKQAIKKG